MNKSFTLIALGALLIGTVACSSAPKVEEQAPMPEVAAAASEPSAPIEEAPAAPAKSSSSSGMSLGAGSSGRGH